MSKEGSEAVRRKINLQISKSGDTRQEKVLRSSETLDLSLPFSKEAEQSIPERTACT